MAEKKMVDVNKLAAALDSLRNSVLPFNKTTKGNVKKKEKKENYLLKFNDYKVVNGEKVPIKEIYYGMIIDYPHDEKGLYLEELDSMPFDGVFYLNYSYFTKSDKMKIGSPKMWNEEDYIENFFNEFYRDEEFDYKSVRAKAIYNFKKSIKIGMYVPFYVIKKKIVYISTKKFEIEEVNKVYFIELTSSKLINILERVDSYAVENDVDDIYDVLSGSKSMIWTYKKIREKDKYNKVLDFDYSKVQTIDIQQYSEILKSVPNLLDNLFKPNINIQKKFISKILDMSGIAEDILLRIKEKYDLLPVAQKKEIEENRNVEIIENENVKKVEEVFGKEVFDTEEVFESNDNIDVDKLFEDLN